MSDAQPEAIGTDALQHVIIVACVRLDEAPSDFLEEAFRREGSRYAVVPCPSCKASMYLGTRSAAMINHGDARAMCSKCAAEFTKQADQVIHTHLSQFMDPPSE